jgi:hypothetical protein
VLQVNPGLAADVTPWAGGGWRLCPEAQLAPSVELLWLGDVGRGACCEIGLEVGGQMPLERGPGADLVPWASVCLGLRF